MQSVMQAAWLLNVAFGNLIVTVVAKAHLIPRQVDRRVIIDEYKSDYNLFPLLTYFCFTIKSMEFFLFAGLIALDIVLFVILAVRYTYVEDDKSIEDNKKKDSSSSVDGADNQAFTADTSI